MKSIERTAYPQFKRLTSARVLYVFFTPAADEVAWARERTASPEALLAAGGGPEVLSEDDAVLLTGGDPPIGAAPGE